MLFAQDQVQFPPAVNLNRILNATMADARRSRLKVDVAARAIRAMGLGTLVETLPRAPTCPGTLLHHQPRTIIHAQQ